MTPGQAYEAVFSALEPALAFPDTGDVRADIADQLHRFIEVLTGAGAALLELVALARTDPDLAAALAAGQVRPGVDLEAVVAQLWGAVYFRALIVAELATAAFADELLANVFDGIASPAATPPDARSS